MQKRNYSTQSIVETGIMSAITIVLVLFTGYVPILSVLGVLILPLPVTMLYIRHGYKSALLTIVVSAILSLLLFDPLTAILSALTFSIIGMILGYCIKNNLKVSTTILLLSVASLILIVLNFILPIIFVDKDSITGFFTKTMNMLDESMKQSIDMLRNSYKDMNLTAEQWQKFDEMASMFSAKGILRTLGASVVIASFMTACINYQFTKYILKRFKYEMKPFTPFSKLYLDSRSGIIVMLPVLIGIILMKKNMLSGEYIFYSAIYIMQFVFVIIGISVVVYFLKNKYNLQRSIIILIVAFTVLIPLTSKIYFFLGLADMLMDFRKVNPNRIFGI